ncbi:hypothetical protein COOONC_07318 [Cooperia oncophora]
MKLTSQFRERVVILISFKDVLKAGIQQSCSWPISYWCAVYSCYVVGIASRKISISPLNVVEGEAGYRLFNGTHQFGFDSTVEDSRGVVVIVEDGDLSGLRECWQSRFEGYSGKFHMFMPVDMIDRSTVRVILESDCLAGIITYEAYNISTDKPLSHDAACPNSESGFSKDACVLNEWNEEGAILPEGLRNIDWKMQILYVHNQTYIDAIRKCHELYNTPPNGSTTVSFPFCSASFGVFSRGAGSSEICMRRTEHWSEYLAHATGSHSSLCGPLRGLNVIAHLPPKVHNDSAGSQSSTRYLMLTARVSKSLYFLKQI